jgi:predicted enzyme involved in methoxymalonyl-ACP biosynthesis
MERFMFDRMMEAAAARGVREIMGIYRPTAKNGLVAGLFEKLGFRECSRTKEEIRYSIDAPEKPPITAVCIRNVSTL